MGLQQEFQRQILGQVPRYPNMEVLPWDSVRTSELWSEYFLTLTAQSVNKCLLSYAIMHLYHLLLTTTRQSTFKNFTLQNFFESQNADAWFGFLISEGSIESTLDFLLIYIQGV